MTHQIHNVYTFENDYETLVDLTITLPVDDLDSASTTLPVSDLNHLSLPSYWRPLSKLQRLYARFQNNILSQWPRMPCVYCGRLLYPKKAHWKIYDSSFTYPLQQHVPGISLSFNPNINRIPELRVPTCESCKRPSTRLPFPTSLLCRKKYFPFLNTKEDTCHLALTGTMNYSRNIRAHALYSGALGAFLESNETPDDVNQNEYSPYDEPLRRAAAWLSQNNPYLRSFTNILSNGEVQMLNDPFPIATHLRTDTSAPPVNTHDIVVPNYDFLNEVHDEDFHYSRLMAGFVQESETLRLPISTNDPNLEPLLFPDIFPDGRGHYRDVLNLSNPNDKTQDVTYGQYIKSHLTNIDARWRLHHHWPSWSYLQLEKLRHHQNTQRLLLQSHLNVSANNNTSIPTARDLLCQSTYSSYNIIDERKTIPIPTFIRTGDTYFHHKQLHLNAMLNKLGLPNLFITLSMAESRWTHLHDILANSDNGDTLPTNRPFHCANYFVHKFQSLKKELYKKPGLTGFGKITNFFDRVEFQNRGAAHTHSCYWMTNTIEHMIENDVIRSTIPDPLYEPELYAAVLANQIHTCNSKCQGPAPPGYMCKKGFPRPYSQTTHYVINESRYVYKCLTEADSWVVPYHPAILLLWDAHINVQYITDKGFTRYMTKYITKREPSHIFNIYENNLLREHIIARRLSSMELMFLLLGHEICNSSATVKFLTTDPPTTRTHSELYFYQQLLLTIPARNESDFKSTPDATYREKFLQYFPDFLANLHNQTMDTHQSRLSRLNNCFVEMLSRLLESLSIHLSTDLKHIIQTQMDDLKLLPRIYPETAMLELPQDQYHVLLTINMYLGKNDGVKWPYFFITGSAGTGKSYIINMITNILTQKSQPFLLLAPTGVAAQNVGGMTIHSALHIISTNGSFLTRAYVDNELRSSLKKITTLIIEEISMVSAELLDFISNMFANLHNNALPFGGLNVIAVGDLAQRPPINGHLVFRAAVWPLFYPLFLTTPHRQHNDPELYFMLEEIRLSNITPETWMKLQNRHSEFLVHTLPDVLLNTTHIVGFRENAQQINRMICNRLPWDPSSSNNMFKPKTNLPLSVRLQPGARVMYLNNSLISHGICNGTIGVVTDVNPTEGYARIAFSVRGSIIDIDIYRQTHYFNINGTNCSHTQFPLQNCFALTVHKTQGLTLPRVCLALDGNIFSPGQAYVALSRCFSWNNIEISHLNRSAFMVDQDVVMEYQRLTTISNANPHLFS
ncbi:AAA family ATPase [Rhizophagus clarus]|uniref:ATP-dependent DNA helicase n=1 Tax=Rhizophagus clarus TaxID=94130 RepID=A0A8H3MDR3_9GLOM|nr:AAA family ATPase [Rhizophagus clarus]